MSHHPRRASIADLAALAAVSVWSVNVIAVKVALRDAPPLTYTAARFLLGGLLLAGVAARLRRPRLATAGPPRAWRADLGPLLAAALLGIAVNQTTFTVALRFTTAVDVSLIIGATPLAVAVHQALSGRERIGGRAWAGLGLGAAGLAVVVEAGAGGHGSLGGDLVALGAPLSWAFYLAALGRLLPHRDVLSLSAVVTLLGALMLAPLGAVEAIATPPALTLRLAGLLLFSAALASAFCNTAYFRALDALGATRVAVYTYLQPFLGAVAAALLLGERLHPAQLLGGAVVVAGVLLSRTPAGGRRTIPMSEPAAAAGGVEAGWQPAAAGPVQASAHPRR